MNILDQALAMAAKGVPVFPLRPNSKVPYKDEGCTVATCDPAAIRQWFAARPGMNYGCATTDYVVIDVDVKHGIDGSETLRNIVGPLPETFEVHTPSGGRHLYYAFYDAGQASIGPGVDVRSHGGYAVGPGSVIDGKAYVVANPAEIAPTPAQLVPHIRPADYVPPLAEREALVELDMPEAIDRGVKYLQSLEGAPEGSRDNTGYKVACRLKDFGISADSIIQLLEEHWNPKNNPPVDRWQLEKLANNAWTSGRNAPGILNPAAEFEPVDIPAGALTEAPAQPRPLFEPLDLSIDFSTVPLRPWLVLNMLQRGQLCGLAAPGGLGKSTLALAITLGIAAGDLSALGLELAKPGERSRVVIVSVEEDRNEQLRRIWGLCKSMGLNPNDLNGWVHVQSVDHFKIMGRDPESRALRKTKAVAELERYIRAHDAAMFVLDPLVELHEADENNNGELAAVMRTVREAARSTHSAGLVIHHTRKGANANDNLADQVRGGSAFIGNVRNCFSLNRATEEDAAAYQLPGDSIDSIFRLDSAKGNYVPPGRHTKWFRTVSLTRQHASGGTEAVPGLERVVPGLTDDGLRNAMAQSLEGALIDAAGELSLADAAEFLARDPSIGIGDPAMIKTRLERYFGGAPTRVTGGSIALGTATRGRARKAVLWTPSA